MDKLTLMTMGWRVAVTCVAKRALSAAAAKDVSPNGFMIADVLSYDSNGDVRDSKC